MHAPAASDRAVPPVPLFLDLPGTVARSDVLRLGQSRMLGEGEVIVREADGAHQVALLLDEWITVSAVAEGGRVAIRGVWRQGDRLGADPLSRPQPASVTAAAMRDREREPGR